MKYLRTLLIFAGISLFSFFYYNQYLEHIPFSVFQTRDLNRVELICQGKGIGFGPELSGGQNLTGSFYYYLIAPSYCFGGWLGVWYFLTGLLALGAGLIGAYIFSLYGWLMSALALVFWFSSPPLILNFVGFWNVSPLGFFIPLCLIGLSEYFRKEDSKFLYTSMFAAGLSTQLHGSMWLIYLASIASFVITKPKHAKKHGFYASLVFLAPLLLSFIFSSLLDNTPSPVYSPSMSATEALSLSLAWQKRIFLEVYSGLYNYIKILLTYFFTSFGSQILIIPAVLYLSFTKSWKSFFQTNFPKKLKLVFITFLIVTALPVFQVAPLPFLARYSLIFHTLHILLVVLLLSKVFHLSENSQKHITWFTIFYCIITLIGVRMFFGSPELELWSLKSALIAIGLILYLASSLLPIDPKTPRDLLCAGLLITLFLHSNHIQSAEFTRGNIRLSDLTQSLTKIKELTGWSYKQVKKNTYMINIWSELDFKHLYDSIETTPQIDPQISGFVIGQFKDEFYMADKIFNNSKLPYDLRKFMKQNATWIHYEKYGNLILLPYKSENPPFRKIHNMGFGYDSYKELELLGQLPLKASGTQKLSKGDYLFYWRCKNMHLDCTTAVHIKITSKSLSAEVIGLPLSQNSIWTQPFWSEHWENLNLSIRCGKNASKYTLYHSLGNPYHTIKNNHHTGLLAPALRTLPAPACKKINSLRVEVENVNEYSFGQRKSTSRTLELEVL